MMSLVVVAASIVGREIYVKDLEGRSIVDLTCKWPVLAVNVEDDRDSVHCTCMQGMY